MRGGDTAAIAEHAGQKSVSAREDRLLRLVISFFEQRIFGPMRIERLEKQLRASARDQRKKGKLAGTRMRQQNAFESESPPGGGLAGGSERHSGGPIRLATTPRGSGRSCDTQVELATASRPKQ